MFPILAEASGSFMDSIRQTGEAFGFDWPLLLSNIVSFLLVCWLLQRFAYKPVLRVLEARRQRIAESLDNAEKIQAQLAEAEAKHAEILARANEEAQKMIAEARAAANTLAESRQQAAIAQAEAVIAQAREVTTLEHQRMLTELRKEVGRLVVETTAKVSGKVLTEADQKRLGEETAREIAA